MADQWTMEIYKDYFFFHKYTAGFMKIFIFAIFDFMSLHLVGLKAVAWKLIGWQISHF